MSKCLYCGKETKNPKYCSQSHAAAKNNSLYPKRIRKTNNCLICHKDIPLRNTYCKMHRPNYVDWTTIKYGEITSKRKYQKNSRIRELCRTKFYNKNPNPVCAICGYKNHVEICHIKPISSHSDNASIAEINRDENIIALCPNHHWELDNGFLPNIIQHT